MTTAMLERRVMKLEAEIRQIKRVMPHTLQAPKINTTGASFKKLPRGVQAGLRDIAAGRVSGPFKTADELMAHLEKR